MEKVPLCVVGCGGMGHRHIMAYKTLEDSGLGNVELMAVCDLRRENAEFAAREVERLFGRKPMIFSDLDQVIARDDILAVDVVTDGSMHHQLAIPALLAGKHALVEKPLGITVRACQAMIEAAEKGSAVLATAENYRFVDDSPSRVPNAPSFKEHRHDQSILSLLLKQANVAVMPAKEPEGRSPFRRTRRKG